MGTPARRFQPSRNDRRRHIWLKRLSAVLLVIPNVLQAADGSPVAGIGREEYNNVLDTGTNHPVEQLSDVQDNRHRQLPPAYMDNGDQTVTDQNSGLTWMKSDDGTPRPWQDAVAYCDGLVFAGLSDWRLPTRFELDSIVDYHRSFPAINPAFSCQASFYWTINPYTGDPAYAWGIYGNDGADHWLDKINRYYVRCVRGGR